MLCYVMLCYVMLCYEFSVPYLRKLLNLYFARAMLLQFKLVYNVYSTLASLKIQKLDRVADLDEVAHYSADSDARRL